MKFVPGFCVNRPKTNVKSIFEDKALSFSDKPFRRIKNIGQKLSTNQISILATLKLNNSALDEYYLLRLYQKSEWLGIRIGENISVEFQKEQLSFAKDIRDDKWHRIGVKIEENLVALFIDCAKFGEYNLANTFQYNSGSTIKIDFGSKYKDGSPGFEV